MHKAISKIIKIVLLLVILAGLFFLFPTQIRNFFGNVQDAAVLIENKYFPCQRPITYKINLFDDRFEISKDDFLKAISEAEQIWEQAAGKQLFTYDSQGDLKMNLVYDYRQEATVKLRQLGLTVNDDKASYDSIKAKYNSLIADYDKKKAILQAQVISLQKSQNEYEREVSRWNARGGAPKDVYDALNQQKAALDAEVTRINKLQDDLNVEVDNINALVDVLNRLVSTLNISVEKFNAIGQERGVEFEGGNYQSNQSGLEINIYQFDNHEKLIQILVHELGHALGLTHSDDPKAVMYWLNEGINDQLTAGDIAALKQQCKLQ